MVGAQVAEQAAEGFVLVHVQCRTVRGAFDPLVLIAGLQMQRQPLESRLHPGGALLQLAFSQSKTTDGGQIRGFFTIDATAETYLLGKSVQWFANYGHIGDLTIKKSSCQSFRAISSVLLEGFVCLLLR